MKIKIILFINVLTIPVTVNYVKAQNASLNGNWNFKDQQSISGNIYENGSPKKAAITQNGDRLKLTTTISTGDLDSTFTEALSIMPFETITGRSHKKKVSVISWLPDHSGFTEISTIYSKDDSSKADYRNTDKWTLQHGQLTLDRKSENFINGETWESTATYTKR